jgi:hypothetical protein
MVSADMTGRRLAQQLRFCVSIIEALHEVKALAPRSLWQLLLHTCGEYKRKMNIA